MGLDLVKREGPAVEVCSLAHNPSPGKTLNPKP